jgi:putative ubiquitin-RnfH superfamily antitoxin RatB of RatAB toxin-antitoxin module
MAEAADGGGGTTAANTSLQVTVVVCLAARHAQESLLALPAGSTVGDALQASGATALWDQQDKKAVAGGADLVLGAPGTVGVWGRAAVLDQVLQHLDRVEIYRPLTVDPKVARRERFARQGARTAGLFARQRPGGKSGY